MYSISIYSTAWAIVQATVEISGSTDPDQRALDFAMALLNEAVAANPDVEIEWSVSKPGPNVTVGSGSAAIQ